MTRLPPPESQGLRSPRFLKRCWCSQERCRQRAWSQFSTMLCCPRSWTFAFWTPSSTEKPVAELRVWRVFDVWPKTAARRLQARDRVISRQCSSRWLLVVICPCIPASTRSQSDRVGPESTSTSRSGAWWLRLMVGLGTPELLISKQIGVVTTSWRLVVSRYFDSPTRCWRAIPTTAANDSECWSCSGCIWSR